ncbi:Lipid A export ATP-binding/permease protein MsbA,lipid transporter ATP-binding/permease protein,ABC-type bacteriocin/lantibiotic exporters, contain an N-terminal double-glycine peptidase domain,lipid A export permease/ATP-binding protein MsbA,ABC transporter transmembrane region [Chlamydia serpentis]|uniref:Lipid A export ATP-binding/permease protein MsbA n=1 Tax=Chlamydia serpentis TaxID=1967782 RepID=A0A2R8FBC5_9CHLA|nr:ABC transporter ATP-binding protein [Chlamydia serpentis]SPN73547.1 Lipid A export ATP-binding/permease protein MsbA,lipid transporter ATP-binding/permease protein,ABC-type bacteriocin/lantibiotic exporters, contain an N-terminal double-glycine peptidase domain,lipid A export permease/ATP-binding protein MsbA,ABC transporter transmembrane region [Chlamydia serpentis]
MKLLLKAILRHKKHLIILGCSLLAILGLTFSSQMEIFSLGMIARTGPDAFLLFGRREAGKLIKASELSQKDVLDSWQAITKDSETITVSQATAYIAEYGKSTTSLTNKLSNYVRKYIDINRFRGLAVFLICVAIFKAVTLFFQRFLGQVVAIRVSRDLRQDYFKALQQLPMTFFHNHDIGNLSNRVTTDSASIALAVNSLMINYIQAPITFILTLAVCLSISWKFSVLICIAFPLFILPIILIAKKIKKLAKRIQKSQDSFSSVLYDFLAGVMTVKVFRTEKFAFTKYCEHNNKISALEERSAAYGLLPRPLLHTIASLFFAFVIVIGIYKFAIPPEELIVFCGLLYLIYDPVKKFGDENTSIIRGCAAAERFYEVLGHPDLYTQKSEEIEFLGLTKTIRFENVSFGYQKDEQIIKDLTFTLRKGEALGIVGPTGSGKTTLVKLLPRLYEVSQGKILIDDLPIREYSKASLRNHIACVLQNPFLFYDTVWNNLTCGKLIKEEDVLEALKRAYADEFVLKLPQGVHSLLEESGKNLSGGQQQRLAIARALLKNASILILDEATSALDAISENYIKNIIGELKGQCTQIIIAHKLTTLEHVDRVLYIENGHKVAEGTKEELLQTCPAFLKMWELSGTKESENIFVPQHEITNTKDMATIP